MILYVNHLYQIWNFLITAQINLNYPEWQNSVSICPGGAKTPNSHTQKKKKKKFKLQYVFKQVFHFEKYLYRAGDGTEVGAEPNKRGKFEPDQ